MNTSCPPVQKITRFPSDFEKDQSRILITCPKGLSPFLRDELFDLGYKPQETFSTGSTLPGSLASCMRLNMCLSTAHRVLFLLAEFPCRNADDLYNNVVALPWEKIIPADEYLCITSIVSNVTIHDSRFANVRCKDGIVDRMVAKLGKRCNSGPERHGVVVHLFWQDSKCSVYLDTSGESIARRGYRTISVEAPLQETLGAGIVRAMRYDGTVPFVNPMCGSGTLAIEAALRALKRPHQNTRVNFGFMHLVGYDNERFVALRKELQPKGALKEIAPIIATDSDPLAIEAAKKNAATAGVEKYIHFETCDFSETSIPENRGVIVVNPEYGFRIGAEKDLEQLYKDIGSFFKHSCGGYKGFVFTGNADLVRCIGLKSTRKTPFLNGSLECRLYEYDLYSGSK